MASSALGSAAIYLAYMGASDSGPPEGTEPTFFHPRRIASECRPRWRNPTHDHLGNVIRFCSQAKKAADFQNVTAKPNSAFTVLRGHNYARSPASNTAAGSPFSAAWRGKTHPTSPGLARRDRSARLAGRAQLPGAQRARDNPGCCCGACRPIDTGTARPSGPPVRCPPSRSSPVMRCEGRVVATSGAAGGGFHGAGRRDGVGWPSC